MTHIEQPFDITRLEDEWLEADGFGGFASGTVGTAMGGYLFSHPDVNNFFTGLRGLPNEEIHGDVQKYMNANPQVESEINGIRQPLTDLGNRCDYHPNPGQ